MASLHQEHPMPKLTIPPLTPEGIEAARQSMQRERDAASRECGIQFDAAGDPYIPADARAAIDRRVACGEAIDEAVETYGLDACIRALQLVAAMNGRTL